MVDLPDGTTRAHVGVSGGTIAALHGGTTAIIDFSPFGGASAAGRPTIAVSGGRVVLGDREACQVDIETEPQNQLLTGDA